MTALLVLSVLFGAIFFASSASVLPATTGPLFPSKLVHLDLKGAPLNVSRVSETTFGIVGPEPALYPRRTSLR